MIRNQNNVLKISVRKFSKSDHQKFPGPTSPNRRAIGHSMIILHPTAQSGTPLAGLPASLNVCSAAANSATQ
ncbi:hypothetical protein, partial [Arthrobacter cryoconiti]